MYGSKRKLLKSTMFNAESFTHRLSLSIYSDLIPRNSLLKCRSQLKMGFQDRSIKVITVGTPRKLDRVRLWTNTNNAFAPILPFPYCIFSGKVLYQLRPAR